MTWLIWGVSGKEGQGVVRNGKEENSLEVARTCFWAVGVAQKYHVLLGA